MPYVHSSAIEAIDYNPATKVLTITFTGGKTYDYYGVPKSVYEAFIAAPSKGTFYNDYIKDHYS